MGWKPQSTDFVCVSQSIHLTGAFSRDLVEWMMMMCTQRCAQVALNILRFILPHSIWTRHYTIKWSERRGRGVGSKKQLYNHLLCSAALRAPLRTPSLMLSRKCTRWCVFVCDLFFHSSFFYSFHPPVSLCMDAQLCYETQTKSSKIKTSKSLFIYSMPFLQ